MLIVLSPAKTLNLQASPVKTFTQCQFLAEAAQLIDILRPMQSADIGKLMAISEDLAQLNANRFATWRPEMDLHTAKQAILTFDGDVYDGLRANEMSKAELNFAQSQLRMLSGLYGLLRPLDLMLPYRLEMGTRLANLRGKDLYAFWGTQITDNIGQAIKESNSQCLLNLASEEYFKAVKPKLLDVPVITPVFEDFKNGQFKVISFFAKRARGSMARFAICHKVRKVAQLKDFAEDGYAFDAQASTEYKWVFRRRNLEEGRYGE